MYLKILIREDLFYVNLETSIETRRQILQGTWHQIKSRERKGPSRGIIQKCAPHERSPCAPKFEERSHEVTSYQERCENIYKLKMLKKLAQMCCVSQDPHSKKSVLRKDGQKGTNYKIQFSRCTWHNIKTRERKGPSLGIIQKCAPHERSPCGPKFAGRSQRGYLAARAMRPQGRVGTWIFFTSSRIWTKLRFYFPVEARAVPAPTSLLPEEREFVVDSGASVHMLSIKELSSDEMETLRRSRNPTTVVTANGEVQTFEEAHKNTGCFVY